MGYGAKKQLKCRPYGLLAVLVCTALSLSACLPGEDYVEHSSDAGSATQIGAVQGVNFAQTLVTTASRAHFAATRFINATSTFPSDGAFDAAQLALYGYDPTTAGISGRITRFAVATDTATDDHYFASYIDPSFLGDNNRNDLNAELSRKTSASDLGFVNETHDSLTFKDGTTITFGTTFATLAVGTPVLLQKLNLDGKNGVTLTQTETQTVDCAAAGFTGMTGTVTQTRFKKIEKDPNVPEVFSNWMNSDVSGCSLASTVDSTLDSAGTPSMVIASGNLSADIKNLIKTTADTSGAGCVNEGSITTKERVLKKDSEGNPVKEDGNFIYEDKIISQSESANCESNTLVDDGTADADKDPIALAPEIKEFACTGKVTFPAEQFLGYTIAARQVDWTGTYELTRTREQITITKDGVEQIQIKTGPWTGHTINCSATDNATAPCSAITPVNYTLESGTVVNARKTIEAKTWQDPVTLTPLIMPQPWEHLSGTCEWIMRQDLCCPSGYRLPNGNTCGN